MSFKDLAMQLVLRGMSGTEITKHFDYRKGKTADDLKKAIKRGMDEGNGKIEHEIGMVELQIQKVLKRKKP